MVVVISQGPLPQPRGRTSPVLCPSVVAAHSASVHDLCRGKAGLYLRVKLTWYILLLFQMKTNVSVHTFVEELPATILWEAINVCALLDFSMSSLVEDAKISMNAVLHKPHAVTVVQTLKVATSVDVHLVTSE